MIKRRQREGERKKGRKGDIEREGEIRERERGERDREVKGAQINPNLRLMLSPNYVSGSQADSY